MTLLCLDLTEAWAHFYAPHRASRMEWCSDSDVVAAVSSQPSRESQVWGPIVVLAGMEISTAAAIWRFNCHGVTTIPKSYRIGYRRRVPGGLDGIEQMLLVQGPVVRTAPYS